MYRKEVDTVMFMFTWGSAVGYCKGIIAHSSGQKMEMVPHPIKLRSS